MKISSIEMWSGIVSWLYNYVRYTATWLHASKIRRRYQITQDKVIFAETPSIDPIAEWNLFLYYFYAIDCNHFREKFFFQPFEKIQLYRNTNCNGNIECIIYLRPNIFQPIFHPVSRFGEKRMVIGEKLFLTKKHLKDDNWYTKYEFEWACIENEVGTKVVWLLLALAQCNEVPQNNPTAYIIMGKLEMEAVNDIYFLILWI